MDQLISHQTDIHETWYLGIFQKSFKKIQVSLKSYKNNRYFPWRPAYIFEYFTFSNFFLKIILLMKKHGNYGRAGQATDNNVALVCCMLDN